MEKVLYIFVHYGVLAVIALLALRAPVRSRAGLAAAAILGLCICLFLFFWGQWPLVGSYYARYLTMAVALIVAGRAVRVWPADSPLFPPSFPGKAAFVLDIALIALTLRLVAGAVGGLSYGGDPAELTLPLKNGTYYVASGGSSKVLNGHMRSRPTAQQFALDINKLGALGGASRNILSSDNEGHHIFGESVFAPCEGEVTSSAADIADNRGSSMDVSVEDGSGNHVTIDCGGLVVSMLHLKQGSVTATEGQRVVTGDLVGQVGNSGFSQEPHLHLQASVRGSDNRTVGVPIGFGGALPVRNSLIRAED